MGCLTLHFINPLMHFSFSLQFLWNLGSSYTADEPPLIWWKLLLLEGDLTQQCVLRALAHSTNLSTKGQRWTVSDFVIQQSLTQLLNSPFLCRVQAAPDTWMNRRGCALTRCYLQTLGLVRSGPGAAVYWILSLDVLKHSDSSSPTASKTASEPEQGGPGCSVLSCALWFHLNSTVTQHYSACRWKSRSRRLRCWPDVPPQWMEEWEPDVAVTCWPRRWTAGWLSPSLECCRCSFPWILSLSARCCHVSQVSGDSDRAGNYLLPKVSYLSRCAWVDSAGLEPAK